MRKLSCLALALALAFCGLGDLEAYASGNLAGSALVAEQEKGAGNTAQTGNEEGSALVAEQEKGAGNTAQTGKEEGSASVAEQEKSAGNTAQTENEEGSALVAEQEKGAGNDATGDNGTKEPAQQMLIVGNSFSRYKVGNTVYSVEQPLEELAAGEGRSLEVTTLAHGSSYLKYYAGMNENHISYYKELMELLVNNTWDYIVFQEQSQAPIEKFYDSTYPAVVRLLELVGIFQPQAKTYLYMTHGFCNNKTLTNTNGVDKLLTAEEMQLYVAAGYLTLEHKLGVEVIPSGMQFLRCSRLYPEIGLYRSDLKHPSYAGYFLAACTFYQKIYGYTPNPMKASLTLNNLAEWDLVRLAALTGDSMKMSADNVTLYEGKEKKLQATPITQFPAYATASYKSLDPAVATVNEKTGQMTAVGAGETAIVAETEDGLQAFCSVTVKQRLAFSRSYYQLIVGERLKVLPKTGNAELTWKSGRKSVATVSDGVVTAEAPGKATITATDESGDSASYIAYVTLSAPSGLKAASEGNPAAGSQVGRVKVSWKAVDGAKKYGVYRSEKKDGTYVLIGTSNKTSYTDKTAAANKTYYYKVASKNSYKLCTSELSESVRGMIPKAPALTARCVKKKYATLSWDKNTKASGYIIYRSTKKNAGYKKVATIKSASRTSYSDKSVKKKKTYYYRIKAYREINGKTFYGIRCKKVKVTIG